MATNVTGYFPNQSQKEVLKALILNKAAILGLYKNVVVPDASTTLDSLSELTTGGGRGYAQIPLTNVLQESALAADKWFLTINSSGKAEADYDNAAQSWTFAAADVADAPTVYGVFAYSWQLPFVSGAHEIKVGDKIKGVTSAATGIVTGVAVQSGTWSGGDAAGYLDIMTKTGTFQNGENITKYGAVASVTVVAGGTGYAVGDIIQITQTGGAGVKLVVTSVGGSNAITGVVVVEGGMGYATATALPTTHLSGSGDDAATITIASVATTTYAVTSTGTTGDALKKLLGVWAFPAGVAITQAGQVISWSHAVAVSTGS